MNFKAFLQGLAAAAIGGAIATTSAAFASPNLQFKDLGKMAGAGALTTAAAYYIKSPLGPQPEKKDE